ncbi:MAG TPA: hypothetical protein VF240_02885, partial [Pyrinomonadaceae bacterium]
MFVTRRTLSIIASIILCATSAAAQTAGERKERTATARRPSVTASATPAGVNFSTSDGVSIRVEVYSDSGDLVFDSGPRQGGEVGWDLSNLGGAKVADGAYRTRLTVGDHSQYGSVKVEDGQATTVVGGPTPAAATNVDDSIVFSSPNNGQSYARDIRLSDNLGGLRFYASPTMTSTPEGAALQFFGNGSPAFPGQAFLDSGAHNNAAVIFRTAQTGGIIAERMRVTSAGNVGIGTNAPAQKLDVAGNIRVGGAGNGIIFPDGSKQTTAGAGGQMTGTSIVTAVNDPATSGFIIDGRLSPNVARLNGANAWSGANVFGAGLSANNSLVTNVGNPVNAGDAVNKAYTDANFVKFVPGAEQLSVGDANGTAAM